MKVYLVWERKGDAMYTGIEIKRQFIKQQADELNERLSEFGYELKNEDIRALLNEQKLACQIHGLIDFDTKIIMDVADIIKASPYLNRYKYLDGVKAFIQCYYACRAHISASVYDDELAELIYKIYLKHHGVFDRKVILDVLKANQEQKNEACTD